MISESHEGTVETMQDMFTVVAAKEVVESVQVLQDTIAIAEKLNIGQEKIEDNSRLVPFQPAAHARIACIFRLSSPSIPSPSLYLCLSGSESVCLGGTHIKKPFSGHFPSFPKTGPIALRLRYALLQCPPYRCSQIYKCIKASCLTNKRY